MQPNIEIKTVALDIQRKEYRDIETNQVVDLKKLINEGWFINGQSTVGDKVIYTLVKSNINVILE